MATKDESTQQQQHGGEPFLPPGFRFHPTDEELVSYYLTKKVLDSSFAVHAISEVDLNKCEPWDLPEKAKMGEKEWYFFSLRDRKYPTGMRTNRATDAGYWKATGKDRDVVTHQPQAHLVGMKKTLVFYRGRAPKGEKTNWIMHEYRLEGEGGRRLPSRANKDEWVVCRIFQKSSGGKRSFLFSHSHMQHGYPQKVMEDTRSSLPPMVDNSPNPTVTDDGACTDCDTCAGTDQISCYNCVPDLDQLHHKDPAHGVLTWISQPMDNTILNTMFSKSYPLGFNHQAGLMQQSKALASLRPKTEPSGEDEAQSIPKGFDYSTWPAGEGAAGSLYNEDEEDPTSPLQSSTNLSCLTGSHCSGSENMNFMFKYRLQDVPAPVDSGLGSQEILWAY